MTKENKLVCRKNINRKLILQNRYSLFVVIYVSINIPERLKKRSKHFADGSHP